VAANEPLLEVTAPIAEAQLVETALPNFVTFQTAWRAKRRAAELTDRLLIFGQPHLRPVLAAYTRHYNQQRSHRGRGLRPPSPVQLASTDAPSPVVRHPILGGLINEYHLAA
jgi:hypothetical protein